MGWLALITALLPLLQALLKWLLEREAAGDGLTSKQQKKVNRLISLTNQIRDSAVKMGCYPGGD